MGTVPTASLSGPLAPGAHSFNIGGITQRYHVFGSGPVCVVHPGGPGIAWDYMRVPALEERLTMVYVEPIGTSPDNRLPSHPHGYTRDRYSRFLEVTINRLGAPRVHLLGHSHGALVAAHHALHRPERLAGVVLYEGAPVHRAGFHSEAEHLLTLLVQFTGQWRKDDQPEFLKDGLHATFISGLDEYLVPEIMDDRAELASLTVPAMVIVGGRGIGDGPRLGHELNEIIPVSQLVTLENSGHVGHVEAPESFTAAVRDFVLGGA
ncbi:alpha/beta hydrolase [Streptomyces sp. NPDC050625]|uniref:alpha/beta fold hydrolase n=1 Tax=Streptomyces sp. NPDC050625 TaxID=3154629 RepID=UPI00341C90E8